MMTFKVWLGIGLLLAITIPIDSNQHREYLARLYNHFRSIFWATPGTNIRQFAVVTLGRLPNLPTVDPDTLPLHNPETWNAAYYHGTIPDHTEPVLFDRLRPMVIDHLQDTGHLPADIYLYTHNIPCIACTWTIMRFNENFRGFIEEFVREHPQFNAALTEINGVTIRIGWNREAGNDDEPLATIHDFLDADDERNTPGINIYRRLTLGGTCNWGSLKKRQAGFEPQYLPNSWYTTTVKRMKHISTGVSGVWAIDETESIYYRPGTYGISDAIGEDKWEVVSGKLKQVDVGYNVVWGVNSNNHIYRRVGITNSNPKGSSWELIDGLLIQISVSSKGNVWGVNAKHEIFTRTASGRHWTRTDGELCQVSVGYPGVWGLTAAGVIYYRTGTFGDPGTAGTTWAEVDGLLRYISSGESLVWGVNKDYQLFYRYGIRPGRPQGLFWVRVAGALKQVEVSERGMWGVDRNNIVQGRQSSPSFDLTESYSLWSPISSPDVKHVSTGWSGVWAVATDKTILYREFTYGSNSNSKGSNGWMIVDGQLDQLDVGNDVVWGVHGGKVYFREGLSRDKPKGQSWTEMDGVLKQVSVSSAGHVWGVNFEDEIFRRVLITKTDQKGGQWRQVQGLLRQISVGVAGVWGVNSDGAVYYRQGTVGDINTSGTDWIKLDGLKFKYVSSGERSVWGVTPTDDIYRREGISASNPIGVSWIKLPGKLKQLEIYDEYNGVWGVNAASKVFAHSC